MFEICLLIIIFIFLVLFYNHFFTDSDVKCCIFLTMYVKNNVELYEKRVKRWLDETDFDIFIVDSSGIGIKQTNERLKQYVFTQEPYFDRFSVSVSEKNSILNAIEYFNDDFLEYDIIFKITGKYFIPNFDYVITTIPDDTDIVFQNLQITHGQNTELVGFRPNIIKDIILNISHEKSFENVMREVQYNNEYIKHRFPPLILDEYARRSDGSTLIYL
jgi:hypothetical protein